MPDNGLTAKGVAARIARETAPDYIEFVARQVRHWTNEHVMWALGPTHPGPGRSRRYSEAAVYQAALLSHLTDLRLPVGVMLSIIAGIIVKRDKAKKKGQSDPWKQAIEGKGPVFLVISIEEVGAPFGFYVSEGEFYIGKLKITPGKPITIVINLSEIFSRVRP